MCTCIVCHGGVDKCLQRHCPRSVDDTVSSQQHAGGSLRDVPTAVPRSAKRCPIANCNARIIHLPRHLREKHSWTTEEARCAVRKYRLRKQCSWSKNHLKQPKCKDHHRPRHCPVANCPAVVKRLDTHLVHSHRMA